ncbi:MAG: sialate O-acetylesterase, partial [Bacteroidota bacterium]
MQKIFSLLFTFFLVPCLVFGQVVVTDFPEHLQLYPRDISSNLATVTAAGTVDLSAITYSEMRLKVYRDGVLQATEVQSIGPGTGIVPFSISYDIPGELNNYKFELLGFNGAENMIQSADSVVAGDMYIIYGQSNGEASMYDGSASGDASPYIRVYGRSVNFNLNYIDWHVGQGDGDLLSDGNTGQWGMKLARNIIDNHAVPVAIFNACWGGQNLDFFTRNDADHDDFSTQYGKTLTRLLQTGGDQKVRGFFWFQGENEADNGESTDSYKAEFAALFSDLKENYTVDQYYMVQIRDGAYFSFNNTLPIQEAQRQLADSIPEMELISTNTLQHHTDDVHYAYVNGYEKMGDISYLMINRDIYGGPSVDIATPTITGAAITGAAEITLYTALSDVLSADAGIETYFILNGTAVTVTGVSIIGGSDIVLSLSGAPTGISSISYSTPVGATNSVINASGVGLTAFNEFPVGTLPIELLSFDGRLLQDQIELSWITASEKNNAHFDIQRSDNGQAWH